MLTCPFCGETDDFDLIGLKGHLMRWCEKYDATPTPAQEAQQRRDQQATGRCTADNMRCMTMNPAPDYCDGCLFREERESK